MSYLDLVTKPLQSGGVYLEHRNYSWIVYNYNETKNKTGMEFWGTTVSADYVLTHILTSSCDTLFGDTQRWQQRWLMVCKWTGSLYVYLV